MPIPPYPTTPLSAQQYHNQQQQQAHLAQQVSPSRSLQQQPTMEVVDFHTSKQQQQQTHFYQTSFEVMETMGCFLHEVYDLIWCRPAIQFENPERDTIRGKRRQIFFRRLRRKYGIPLAPTRPPGEGAFSTFLSCFFSIASSLSSSTPTTATPSSPPKEKVGELEKELEALRSQIAILMQSNQIVNNLPSSPATPVPFSPLPSLSTLSPPPLASPSLPPPPPPPPPPHTTPLQKPVVILKRKSTPRSPLSPAPSSSSSSGKSGVSLDDILQSRTTLRRVKGSPRKNSKARTKQREDTRLGVLSKALNEKFKNTSSPTKTQKKSPSENLNDEEWVEEDNKTQKITHQENSPFNKTNTTPLFA